jgi:hypothetical protein
MTLEEQIQDALERNDFDELDRLTAESYAEEGDDTENSDIETEDNAQEAEADKANEGETDDPSKDDDPSEGETQGEQEAATAAESEKTTEVEAGSQPTELDGSKITFDEKGNAVIPKELLSVLAKDGKHALPYGVLEGARGSAKELKTQLDQERQLREKAESELTKSGRLIPALKKQLEKNGIDPEELPEDLQLTDELLDSLDDYGEVGKVIKALVAKQKQVSDTASQAAPQAVTQPDNSGANTFKVELDDYTQKNPEFAKIFSGSQGDDHFDTLDLFYRQVDSNPEFNGKPLSDKLDAAMERYRKVYPSVSETDKDSSTPTNDGSEQLSDEALQQAAQAKVKEAQESSAPASPSEVGNSAGKTKSNLERAMNATGAELLQIMEELTPEELEQLQDQCFN